MLFILIVVTPEDWRIKSFSLSKYPPNMYSYVLFFAHIVLPCLSSVYICWGILLKLTILLFSIFVLLFASNAITYKRCTSLGSYFNYNSKHIAYYIGFHSYGQYKYNKLFYLLNIVEYCKYNLLLWIVSYLITVIFTYFLSFSGYP